MVSLVNGASATEESIIEAVTSRLRYPSRPVIVIVSKEPLRESLVLHESDKQHATPTARSSRLNAARLLELNGRLEAGRTRLTRLGRGCRRK